MNWGYKIALAYGSFVIMILFFLFVASQQSNEMIEDHYYEKELQFQNVLIANENLSTLNVTPSIKIVNQQVQIELPLQVSSQVSNGVIEFLRLSDKSKDISSVFTPDDNGKFSLSTEEFHTGVYQMRIQWKDHGIPYRFHDEFNYQKP